MENRFISDNNILLLRQRKKFGLDYFEAVVAKGSNKVTFPYFLSQSKLNAELWEIIDAYPSNVGNMEMKLLFADDKFISLSFNDLYSVNFSIVHNAFLPEKMVMKICGIKKRYYKRVLHRVKKRYHVIETSFRCTRDGIRIDVVDKISLIKSPLKIRNTKKISQIT